MCGEIFYSPEACVGVAKPTMMISPPSGTPSIKKVPQKLVKCGPYYVPIPRVTTLGDTIEEAMRKPPEGWQDWLQKNQIWDENMSEQAAFTRYYKFHKIKFDAIPETQWPTYYRKLAELEELFVVGDAIGEVPG